MFYTSPTGEIRFFLRKADIFLSAQRFQQCVDIPQFWGRQLPFTNGSTRANSTRSTWTLAGKFISDKVDRADYRSNFGVATCYQKNLLLSIIRVKSSYSQKDFKKDSKKHAATKGESNRRNREKRAQVATCMIPIKHLL